VNRPAEEHESKGAGAKLPLRLLVVMPSWLGDVVMATPALRLLRDAMPGAFIGGLVRPGLDELIAGGVPSLPALLDEVHVDRARGVMGPKLVASKIRPRKYDAALLLANSFSSALITRLAFIPRRIGYDRDGRGLLLTDRIAPEREGDGVLGKMGVGRFTPVPAVEYYLRAARQVVDVGCGMSDGGCEGKRKPRLELGVTEAQAAAATEVLGRAGVAVGERYAVLVPGANDLAKRWPAERFGAVAAHLVRVHGLKVLVSGAPNEAEICDEVVRVAMESMATSGRLPAQSGGRTGGTRNGGTSEVVAIPRLGVTIGALKGVVRGASLMVANDTGPRLIAAALGVPLVVLYGPTDLRWTVVSGNGGPMIDVVADPTLPPETTANEHPERCRIDRIEVERVVGAVEQALGGAGVR
jgi:heptosyltransferase-2